jgi:lipopolysaccharide exporter
VTTGGLFHRAVRSGIWVFALSISQEIIGLARLVILARLLSPNDFGLAGIAVLTLTAMDALSQPNFDAALIHKKQDIRPYLDSAWTVGVIRGAGIFVLLYFIAPYGASFFRAPQAVPLIRAIGLAMLARAFTNAGVVYFRKDLDFKRQFVWQSVGRIADFVVAVVAAFALHNAWALVLAFISGDVVKLALSYALHPHRPRFALDRARTREMFVYGKWLLGVGIIVFLLTQIDNAVVGRLAGATMLGFYQLARRISNAPATEIAHVIANVAFPAYSKVQDRAPKLREGYLMVLEVTALFSLPMAGAIITMAPEITLQFFGQKWLPAVGAIQVLAIWGAFGALQATAEPVLMAVGKPRVLTKYQAIQLAGLACLIYPLTARWGIRGTALAMVVAAAGPSWLALKRIAELTGCGRAMVARTVGLPALGTAAACAAVEALKRWGVFSASPVLRLGFAMALYALAYAGMVIALARRFNFRLRPVFQEVLAIVRSRTGTRGRAGSDPTSPTGTTAT